MLDPPGTRAPCPTEPQKVVEAPGMDPTGFTLPDVRPDLKRQVSRVCPGTFQNATSPGRVPYWRVPPQKKRSCPTLE